MSYKRYTYKVILVGDSAVGKTSLIKAYIEKKFNFDYLPTLGANILKKEFVLPERNTAVTINFWDIAGQTLFANLHKTFFEGSNGIMLIFDVTKPKTFENLGSWYSDLKKFVKEKKAPGVLIANKVDLEDKREITTEKGKEYADKIKYYYIETSALQNKNVADAFKYLLQKLLPGVIIGS